MSMTTTRQFRNQPCQIMIYWPRDLFVFGRDMIIIIIINRQFYYNTSYNSTFFNFHTGNKLFGDKM